MHKTAAACVTASLVILISGCAIEKPSPTGTPAIQPSPSAQEFEESRNSLHNFAPAHPLEGEIAVNLDFEPNPDSVNLNFVDVPREIVEMPLYGFSTLPLPKTDPFTFVELEPGQSVVQVHPFPYPPDMASQRWKEIEEIDPLEQGLVVEGQEVGVTFFGFKSPLKRVLYEIRVVPIT